MRNGGTPMVWAGAVMLCLSCAGESGDSSGTEADAGSAETGGPESGGATSGGDSAEGAEGADGSDADGGGDGSTTGGPVDPGAEFCPWILDHEYGHESDVFFEPTVVTRIDVEMTDEDWQYQLDNPDLEEYRPASLTFCGERLEQVGMRFKKSPHQSADLEEGYPKNPIVFDLNELVPGQRLRKLRKINLEYGSDQMLVAERLNWEMLMDFGLPVSRVNHTQLYLNGDHIGLFTNIERVDRSYANYHFGENEGQLYKHSYCADFLWKGPDFADYNGGYAGQCYVPKPEDSMTDHAELLTVIDTLNSTPDADFEAVFPTIWNSDEWIPTLAALQTLAYADTPVNGNNFYTYYPAPGAPTLFALWDLDGGYWWDGAPCEHPADVIGWDLFKVADCHANVPLFHRVMDVDSFRQRYLEDARDFLLGPFDPSAFVARVDEVVTLITPALAADPNRRGDDVQWADDLDALRDLQAQRAQNVREQLEALGIL